jgi:hypothetical protein
LKRFVVVALVLCLWGLADCRSTPAPPPTLTIPPAPTSLPTSTHRPTSTPTPINSTATAKLSTPEPTAIPTLPTATPSGTVSLAPKISQDCGFEIDYPAYLTATLQKNGGVSLLHFLPLSDEDRTMLGLTTEIIDFEIRFRLWAGSLENIKQRVGEANPDPLCVSCGEWGGVSLGPYIGEMQLAEIAYQLGFERSNYVLKVVPGKILHAAVYQYSTIPALGNWPASIPAEEVWPIFKRIILSFRLAK